MFTFMPPTGRGRLNPIEAFYSMEFIFFRNLNFNLNIHLNKVWFVYAKINVINQSSTLSVL